MEINGPAIRNGHNAGAVLGHLKEHWHGKIEMGSGRVAPAAVVIGLGVIGGAEVGGGDEDGGVPWVAPLPLRLISAFQLEARAAAEPVVEQRCAQRRRVHAVPLAVQIPVPTSSACNQLTTLQFKLKFVIKLM